MRLLSVEIDHTAPLALRERFAFSERETEQAVGAACAQPGVSGSALLSTCNRTMLCLSVSDEFRIVPETLLCTLRGLKTEATRYIAVKEGAAAARRLFETTCGLRSRLRFEEQIISQVRQALAISHRAGCTDEYIERLFQSAVACGKKARATVPVKPGDASKQILEVIRSAFPSVEGLRCLVIGSGQMGRLTAQTLNAQGARVMVTTRQYHYGCSVAPQGCAAVPYEQRCTALANSDVAVGATRSPHYTLTIAQAGNILSDGRPRLLIDLAVPRDFEPGLGGLGRTRLVDIDALYGGTADTETSAATLQTGYIVDEAVSEFSRWLSQRWQLPLLQAAAAAVADKLNRHTVDSPDRYHEAAAQVLLSLFCELQKTCGDALTEPLSAYAEKYGGKAAQP